MTVDETVKLMLAIGFTFSLAGISFSIMMLIGKFTAILQDLRKVLQNTGVVSDLILEDYNKIRSAITGIFGGMGDLIQGVSLIKSFLSRGKKSSKHESNENTDY